MKNILFAILSFVASISFGQDRVNSTLPKITSQDLGSLSKAIGWLLNEEGQWVSSNNKLPKYSTYTHSVSISGDDGLGYDNFYKYEFRELIIGSDTLMILIKSFTSGYYKYPSISEGWSTYKMYDYYVFKRSELSKLDLIANSSINLIELGLEYMGSNRLSYNGNYISDIEKEIAVNKNSTDSKLVFHIAPYKEKSLVRFQIYLNSYSKYSKKYSIKYSIYGITGLGVYDKVTTPDGRYYFVEKQIYMTDELFNHLYYEVDYLTFSKFIKLK